MTRQDIGTMFGCLSMIGMAVGLFLLLTWAIESTADREFAQLESLRVDAARVSADVGEDVIGQVTEANQRIVWNQVTNDYPVMGFFISDRWEDVERIEVPE